MAIKRKRKQQLHDTERRVSASIRSTHTFTYIHVHSHTFAHIHTHSHTRKTVLSRLPSASSLPLAIAFRSRTFYLSSSFGVQQQRKWCRGESESIDFNRAWPRERGACVVDIEKRVREPISAPTDDWRLETNLTSQPIATYTYTHTYTHDTHSAARPHSHTHACMFS